MLCDTGPLLVVLNNADPDNLRCVAALSHIRAPLFTVEPCIAEAMHFLGRMNGFEGQSALWRMIEAERLLIVDLTTQDRRRAQEVMRIYRDRPCDYADACLLALCEQAGIARIFSLDSDFYIYRLANGKTLEVIPGPAR